MSDRTIVDALSFPAMSGEREIWVIKAEVGRQLEERIADLEQQLADQRKSERLKLEVHYRVRDDLKQQLAELNKAIDDINVGVKDGKCFIWIWGKPGMFLSARDAIDAAIGKDNETKVAPR